MRDILRATGKQAERQEVAWACARALRPRACAYWREEEGDRGGEVVGWAGQMELGQVSPSLSLFYFLLLFCFI